MEARGRYGVLGRRVTSLKNRLSRARYFRGHGVHSPFVYGIVRQVFMCDGLCGDQRDLHDALIAHGVSPRRAVELQNLMNYCHYRSFVVAENALATVADMVIVLRSVPDDVVRQLAADANQHGHTLVVVDPYADSARERVCRSLVAGHGSTTVDNRGYLLMFNDRRLPKQHFRI